MLRKTKIIATLGPATDSPEIQRDLIAAGATVFRINMSHAPHEVVRRHVRQIREIAAATGTGPAILMDLQGPAIRTGEVPATITLQTGDEVELRQPGTTATRAISTTTNYPGLAADLKIGATVLVDNGVLHFQVISKDSERIICRVLTGGQFGSRRHINLPGTRVNLPGLTENDLTAIDLAAELNVDFVAMSFVRDAAHVRDLRRLLTARQSTAQIVAKIERMEAVNDLERILVATDMVMVARGDLGVEVDFARVPGLQKRIIRLCNQHRIPVITATQMLDSMQKNSRPTRAEASDVANAVLDGSDAIMLSGESAAGDYPVEAVSMMNRLAHEAERLRVHKTPPDISLAQVRTRALEVTEAVTHGAGIVAEMLGANLIVVATRSGKTALSVSNQRLQVPILGLTPDAHVANKMALFWGVTPLIANLTTSTPEEILDFVVQWGMNDGVLKSGSKVVLIAASNWSAHGHNQLLVHAIP